MNSLTPEQIQVMADAAIKIIAAIGTVAATLVSTIVGYFTWKTRYELDQLYAAKYRPNPDGTPGPMRHHSKLAVKLFKRKARKHD